MNNETSLSMHSKLVRQSGAFLTVSLICFQLAAKYWGNSSPKGDFHWWVPVYYTVAAVVLYLLFLRRSPVKKLMFFITLVILIAALWIGYFLGQASLDYRFFGGLGIFLFVIAAVSCICLFCKRLTETLQKAIDIFYGCTPSLVIVGSATLLIRAFADLVNAKVSDWYTIPFVIIVLAVIMMLAISPRFSKVNPNTEVTKSK